MRWFPNPFWVKGVVCLLGVAPWASLCPGQEVQSEATTWRRWEQPLASDREYEDPCADVVLRIRFTGPDGREFRSYGFWDGGSIFRVRCAFPAPGTWRWETDCSDAANVGLHQKRGVVEVREYQGDNPLYRHGFLKVSANRRHLVHDDATPFLWIGDTAWAGPHRADDREWGIYLADRAAKRFTLIQVAAMPTWGGETNREGDRPFTDKAATRWNPAYWQAFDRKIEQANEEGLAVLVVGLMETVKRYPPASQARLIARNLVARLSGDFALFSPSFDSPHMPLGDEVGRAIRDASSVHLITQHPGTPSGKSTPIYTMSYYDQDYLDIAGVQSGHNGGNRERCARQAIEWNLFAHRHEPHKPVINLEAMYDAHEENAFQASDARGLGWRSLLSGAAGYTYGAGDVAGKAPNGNGGLWMWVTDPSKHDYWERAIHWESSTQMQYLHDFLTAIDWWRLEPAHELIRNPANQATHRALLAKTATGDLAIAYLPKGEAVEVDVSGFPAPLRCRWFDPVRGRYAPAPGVIDNQGVHRFEPPAQGDWALEIISK